MVEFWKDPQGYSIARVRDWTATIRGPNTNEAVRGLLYLG